MIPTPPEIRFPGVAASQSALGGGFSGAVARADHRRLGYMPLAERQQVRVATAVSLLWFASFVIGFKTTLALMTALGFLLALIGLAIPMYGLIGICILCSIDSLTRTYLMTGGLLRYHTFNYFLLFTALALLPVHFRQKDIHTWLIRIFIALLLIGLIRSPGIKNGVLHILNMVTVFGLYTYFYRCRQNPRMWYLIALTVGMSSAFGGLAFFFNSEGLSFSKVREELMIADIRDTNWIDPNAFAYLFVTALFGVAFGLASNAARGIEQTILYLLFATNLCWVFLVGSRGGMMVSSVVTLYVLFSARSASRMFQIFAAGAIAVLLLVNAFPALRDRAFHRVEKLANRDLSVSERTSNRSVFVVAALRMFRDHPFGVGTGGFGSSWTRLNDTRGISQSSLKYEKSSHSAWLKTIAENGLPGILLFTALVGSFAFAGFRQGHADAIAVGLLATTVLALSFTATEFQSKGLWFLVAGSIVFLHHRPTLKRNRQPKPQSTVLHGGMVVKR